MTTTDTAPTVSPIAKIEALYERLNRARRLVADGKVYPIYGLPNYYVVEGANARYLINGEPCLCPDSVNRPELKHLCKHRLSVELFKESQPTTYDTAPSQTDPDLERKIAELYS